MNRLPLQRIETQLLGRPARSFPTTAAMAESIT